MNKLRVAYCLCLLAGTQLQAAELALQYYIDARAESDSNVRLSNTDKTKIQGAVISPQLSFTRKTATLELGLDAGADFSHFNKSRFNSDDQNAAVRISYQTAHSEVGAHASFDRTSTRSSELEDTGRFQNAAIRREQGNAGVNWSYTINRTNGLELSGQLSEVDYATDQLRDYETKNASLTYTHILNKRISLQAVTYIQDYTTKDGFEVSANTYGGQLGVVAALSRRFNLTVLVGGAKTEQDIDTIFGTFAQSSENFVVNSSLKYAVRQYEASLGFTRSVTPSGNGFVQLSTIGRGDVMCRLGKYTQVFANFVLGSNETVGNTFDSQRDFQSASAGLRYQFAKAWRLSARYRYRTQEPFNTNDKAKSNAVYLTLKYQPLARKWKS
ncbi:MAG: hypothetical protein KUG75_10320 [Pseudomonadales bacterium]|nr:hypothetical protein [Pseudomonadales bacterium]